MEEELKTVQEENQTVEVVDIQFRPGQKVYYFDPAGQIFQAGDHVIIDTARGPEFGYCAGGNHTIAAKDVVTPLRSVLRLATAEDERTLARNRAAEKRALEICQQKSAPHGLDMQLVSAEYAFDGSKILFFFTADERVDFRELVKNLASVFHTRIELRQIGVRDKAKMVGGLGICGRPFCCASFLDDFQPVSIKMAKTQNLSLNPTKISGTCGRLMCCLKYEQEAYEDLLRTAPKTESFVDTPEGRGTVVEIDLLRQRVMHPTPFPFSQTATLPCCGTESPERMTRPSLPIWRPFPAAESAPIRRRRRSRCIWRQSDSGTPPRRWRMTRSSRRKAPPRRSSRRSPAPSGPGAAAGATPRVESRSSLEKKRKPQTGRKRVRPPSRRRAERRQKDRAAATAIAAAAVPAAPDRRNIEPRRFPLIFSYIDGAGRTG